MGAIGSISCDRGNAIGHGVGVWVSDELVGFSAVPSWTNAKRIWTERAGRRGSVGDSTACGERFWHASKHRIQTGPIQSPRPKTPQDPAAGHPTLNGFNIANPTVLHDLDTRGTCTTRPSSDHDSMTAQPTYRATRRRRNVPAPPRRNGNPTWAGPSATAHARAATRLPCWVFENWCLRPRPGGFTRARCGLVIDAAMTVVRLNPRGRTGPADGE